MNNKCKKKEKKKRWENCYVKISPKEWGRKTLLANAQRQQADQN